MSERKIVYGARGRAHYTTGYFRQYAWERHIIAYCGASFNLRGPVKVMDESVGYIVMPPAPICKHCKRIAKASAAHGR